MTDPKIAIENHPNLLEDELKEMWDKISTDIIQGYRLPIKLFETRRTKERQQYLFDNKKSTTLNSRHLPNIRDKSEAFDVVVLINGKPSWDKNSIPFYKFFGEMVMQKYPTQLEWGGNWKTFVDLPHFQMKKTYGAKVIISV